jgi:hypothetical protein
MNALDRTRLLFGPYKAPALQKGDCAFCLARDCDVIITGWTDAPIPWPRCRAFDTRGGGSGILVDDELARAIRHESAAAAVKRWWGASSKSVNWWRKALGVTRTKNEGTHNLIVANAKEGASVIQQHEFTGEEREARRQTALRLNLGQFVGKGNPLTLWTCKELALLGTMSDDEVAQRTGRSVNAVRQKRQEMGKPNRFDRRYQRRG